MIRIKLWGFQVKLGKCCWHVFEFKSLNLFLFWIQWRLFLHGLVTSVMVSKVSQVMHENLQTETQNSSNQIVSAIVD